MDPAPTHRACQRGAGSDQWLHEIKFDGYRMHARFDRGAVRLLCFGIEGEPRPERASMA